MADNAFYLYENGKVTCVLGPDDYKAATQAMKGLPNECYFGGDGTFYLGYYYVAKGAYEGTAAAIWRVTPDGKVEPYATNIGKGHSGGGDAMTQAGWYCGPHLGRSNVSTACRFIPPDAVLTSAHDEDMIRRIQKGRVSTLCVNGEWREFGKGLGHGRTELYAAERAFGPNGTLYYARRPWQEMRLYRYTGLDLHKPTVNKRAK